MRAERGAPDLLDNVVVKSPDDGKAVPLSQLAQVATKDPQNLTVTVFDPPVRACLFVLPVPLNDGTKQQTDAVAMAIRAAGLNLNPVVDKNVVRVPLPKYVTNAFCSHKL